MARKRGKQIDTMMVCPDCGRKCPGLFKCADHKERCAYCVKEYNSAVQGNIEIVSE